MQFDEVNNLVKIDSESRVENPLIWPILTLLSSSQQSYKIHTLGSELTLKGLLTDLDNDANKALFKRNFLLMNALYQLQGMLLPTKWLQVDAMNIQILTLVPTNIDLIVEQDVALRSYYLDWSYFETSAESIETLFTSFWNRYQEQLGKPSNRIDKDSALLIFELDNSASQQDIRRQWRRLALKWHPDRASGDAIKFREICGAWQTLRA